MKRVQKQIRVDPQAWQAARIEAVRRKLTLGEYLEYLIAWEIKREGTDATCRQKV